MIKRGLIRKMKARDLNQRLDVDVRVLGIAMSLLSIGDPLWVRLVSE